MNYGILIAILFFGFIVLLITSIIRDGVKHSKMLNEIKTTLAKYGINLETRFQFTNKETGNVLLLEPYAIVWDAWEDKNGDIRTGYVVKCYFTKTKNAKTTIVKFSCDGIINAVTNTEKYDIVKFTES